MVLRSNGSAALVALVLAGAASLPASGALAESKVTVSNGERSGYDGTMLCVLANIHARGERLRVGDNAKAAVYAAQTEKAFGVAVIEGEALGFPHDRIESDLRLAEDTQLPRMLKDQAYFYSVVAKCKYLKLM